MPDTRRAAACRQRLRLTRRVPALRNRLRLLVARGPFTLALRVPLRGRCGHCVCRVLVPVWCRVIAVYRGSFFLKVFLTPLPKLSSWGQNAPKCALVQNTPLKRNPSLHIHNKTCMRTTPSIMLLSDKRGHNKTVHSDHDEGLFLRLHERPKPKTGDLKNQRPRPKRGCTCWAPRGRSVDDRVARDDSRP